MLLRQTFTVAALFAALAITGSAQVKVERVEPKSVQPDQGKAMFMEYCAACHGREGKGNGPAASALKKAPADLTRLAATSKNGKFPDVRVSRYIQGADEVDAHGTRDMPVWGEVFRSVSPTNSSVAAMRVTNLTEYVRSIQSK